MAQPSMVGQEQNFTSWHRLYLPVLQNEHILHGTPGSMATLSPGCECVCVCVCVCVIVFPVYRCTDLTITTSSLLLCTSNKLLTACHDMSVCDNKETIDTHLLQG